ncbi:WD40 repeat-like protein [Hortaea werneckii]|nr:WD40 repeat-like protein [Hortaea werneckii]KAI7449698.1 WD40 repeat-like protein [Hortaea werneckii]
MSSSNNPQDPNETPHLTDDQADALLGDDEADETIEQDDNDAAMDSGDDEDDGANTGDVDMEGPLEQIELHNDSVAHFDHHKDSLFCIAQHPTRPELVVTGGGDDIAYLWSSEPVERRESRVLPQSYESNPQPVERKGQDLIAKLDGQDESVNAVCFTLPAGDFVATASLAGKLSVYATPAAQGQPAQLVGTAKEVEEINWLLPCPNKNYPNTLAFGASDGSVWVYTVNPSDPAAPLTIVQTFFLHQAPCTAGAWTPDGKMLATVSEDSSLYVWDVFGDAAAAGLSDPLGGGSQAVVGLTGEDERFRVDGGLYSVAVSPGGGIVAVGGAEGNIRIVGLPRLSAPAAASNAGAKGAGAKSKTGGAKQAHGPRPAAPASAPASAGQAGSILASLQAQSDGVETLDFSQPPLTLLAAGSVDGSIALYDAAHNFAVRRHIRDAHEEEAVIQVGFVKTPLGTANERGWLLTSCGNDGVVRRRDVRGGTTAAAKGLVREWRGHRGGGEGGGILGFVQAGGDGKRIVTAGDDGVGLVFEES